MLGEDRRHRYLIYTTETGRRRCEQHPLLEELSWHVTVAFKSLEALANYTSSNKYLTKSECYAIELDAASAALTDDMPARLLRLSMSLEIKGHPK